MFKKENSNILLNITETISYIYPILTAILIKNMNI